jgi:uncharacterized RDD family membrane protein YckC
LQWTDLAELPGVLPATGGEALLMGTSRAAKVLLAGRDERPNRLFDWQAGRGWREVELTGDLAQGAPLAMLTIGQGKGTHEVVVLATPQGEGGRVGVRLAIPKAGWSKVLYQQVTMAGQAVTWPPGTTPLVARLGVDQLAMVWPDGEKIAFAVVEANGKALRGADVDVFRSQPSTGLGASLYQGFVLVFMGGMLVWSIAMRRRRMLVGPFTLPAGARLPTIPRRLLAAAIDLLPFYFLAALLFPIDVDSLDELVRLGRDSEVPDSMWYAQIAAVCGYVTYSLVAELRYGATVGKRIMRLRVVGEAGRPGAREVVLRNLARVVELSPIIAIVTLAMMVLTRSRQRFGDFLARTTVIDAASRLEVESPPSPDEGAPPSDPPPSDQ